jgi:septin family protein
MLYFFGSSHHSTDNDFIFLKQFQTLVNVIPVIAKADSFKSQELLALKSDIIYNANKRKVTFFDCIEAIDNVS